MSPDEAGFCRFVTGRADLEDDALAEIVSEHARLMRTTWDRAQRDFLAEICRRLKHDLALPDVADGLWEAVRREKQWS